MRTVLPIVVILSALLASCGGGGSGGGTTAVVAPPSLGADEIFLSSSLGFDVLSLLSNITLTVASPDTANRIALDQINFDVRLGRAGQGVTVAIADEFPDTSVSFLSHARTTVLLDVCGGRPTCVNARIGHGTAVSGTAIGKIGATVYGPAHRADLEILALDSIPAGSIASGVLFDRLNTLGVSAKVVNLSFGPVTGITLTTQRQINPQIPAGVALSIQTPERPSLTVSFNNFQQFFVDDERLAVWAAGNEGYSATGLIDVEVLNALRPRFALTFADITSGFNPADARRLNDMLYSLRPVEYLWPLETPLVPERQRHFLVVGSIDPGYVRGSNPANARLASYSNACGVVKAYCLVAPGEINQPMIGSRVSRGTSFAAPYVTGVVAALMSTYPTLPVTTVATIVLTTATDLGAPGVDDEFGHGLLDFTRAMRPLGTVSSTSGFRLTETDIEVSPALAGALTGTKATFGMFDMHQRPYMYYVAARTKLDNDLLDNFPTAQMRQVNDGLDRMAVALENNKHGLEKAMVSDRRFGMSIERCEHLCAHHNQIAPGALLNVSNLVSGTAKIGTNSMAVAEMGSNSSGQLAYQLGALRVEHSISDLHLGFEAGYLSEQNTFLGSQFNGAFGVEGAYSKYINAQLTLALPKKLALHGSATFGVARASPVSGSYVDTVEPTAFDAVQLGIGGKTIGNGVWQAFITRPLKATSGGLSISSVGGYRNGDNEWSVVSVGDRVALLGEGGDDGGGELRVDHTKVDFSAGRRPVSLGMAWRERRGSKLEIATQLEYVLNSVRRGFADQEARAVLQLKYSY